MRARIASVLTFSSCLFLSACQLDRVIVSEVVTNEEGLVIPGPFAPDEMRVHPLTHTEKIGNELRLVVHVELLDGWGDTVKGLGTIRAELERSDSQSLGDGSTTWDIDISGIEKNMSYFDSVTRTYRFVFTGVPAWFVEQSGGTLRVLFRTARSNGDINALRDEYQVRVSRSGG